MGSLTYSTEAEWHAIRARHVGGSEIAAVFGLSPFKSKWQLYMEKAGKLPAPDLSGNPAVNAGRHLEPGIASWAAEKWGLNLQKARRYCTDDQCPGLGSSLDYECVGSGTRYPVEIKLAMRHDGWEWDGDDLTQIPQNYVMQLQTQMACTGAAFGELVAYIGGDVRRMRVPRSDKIIAAIRREVARFWEDVRNGKEPEIDFAKDADAINELAFGAPLRDVELPPECAAIFQQVVENKERAKAAGEAAKAAQAELIALVMDSPSALGNTGKARIVCGPYRMSLSKIDDNPGRAAVAGEIVGARKGYLNCRITQEKTDV